MKILNTLTKQKEEFVPIKPGYVSIYQCGPTVYWTQHIGNMRAATVGDLARRTFEYLGYKTDFVRNYTDVGHLTSDADAGEDKMDKAARRDQMTPEAIAARYTGEYNHDVRALNILAPTHAPKATDNIREMKAMIVTLLKKGFAYETELAIYFDTSKARDYTRLSGQKMEANEAGQGHGDVEDPQKKNASDFALWIYKKGSHANALQTWSSPKLGWFKKAPDGFPGWHIECSAMAKRFLGPTIDVHIGGIEHIPVHHTNEIAQSENANDVPFTHYWMHNEHLLINNGKMSKSEGTAYSLPEVIEKGFDPLALRFFFLQAHYRSKQNFTWDALEAAANGLKKLRADVARLDDASAKPDVEFVAQFKEKLGDDFNTPQALAVVYEVLSSPLPEAVKRATILDFDTVLGLKLADCQVLGAQSPALTEIPTEIIALAQERQKAREAKDFAKSDALRDEIAAKGFAVKDTPTGFEVTRI